MSVVVVIGFGSKLKLIMMVMLKGFKEWKWRRRQSIEENEECGKW